MLVIPNDSSMLRAPSIGELNRYHPHANDVIAALFMTPNGDSSARQIQDAGPFRFRQAISTNVTFGDTPYGKAATPASGSGIVIAASDNHQAVNEVTMLARVKCGADSGRNWIVIRGSNPINYWLTPHDNTVDLGSGAGFYNAGYNKSGINTNVMNDGKWHVLAGTIKNEGSGARLRYFIDGRLDAENTTASNMPSVSYALNVGLYDGDATFFNGQIEFVIVLRRALGIAAVAALSANPYALLAHESRLIIANGGALSGGGAGGRRGNICVVI